MRKTAIAVFLVVAVVFFFGGRTGVNSSDRNDESLGADRVKPQSSQAVKSTETPTLTSLLDDALGPVHSDVKVRDAEERNIRHPQTENPPDSDSALASFLTASMPPPLLSFEGIANYDNIAHYQALFLPPDMVGDVGPSHYVQAVNSLLRIYSKKGEPLTPAFKMSTIFSSLNTICSARNDGDPIVLYDTLADRWLISQYCTAFPPFRQMIAISKTGDPMGQYFAYEFVMPNMMLNDFPKLGIWADGYYMSTDEFIGSDHAGTGVFAFDRAKMLIGDPTAGYIYFRLPTSLPTRVGGLLPADLDGLESPELGDPNIFVGYSATEYGQPQDAVRLFDFHADFLQPSLSTFTERSESPIPVAAFDPTSPEGRTDILQPSPGAPLDSNSDRLMFRAAYRSFVDRDSIVVNQTVRVSGPGEQYRAGVRVYELRKRNGVFSVAEQSTITSPGDSRWIGTAAQDHQGNIAVGYNIVNDEKPASIYYTGRLANDPAGQYRIEASLVDGTGVQKAFGFRWGDYSSMSVDPIDDCTFWLTGEYFDRQSEEFSDFTWLTRIGSFKFSECAAAIRGNLWVNVVDASNDLPIPNADIYVYAKGRETRAPFFRRTAADGSSGTIAMTPGEVAVFVRAGGYRPETVTANIAPNSDNPVIVRLVRTPRLEIDEAEVISESCSPNRSAEPGETVTVNLTIRNSGTLNTQNLRLTLLPSDKIAGAGIPVNFGPVMPNSAVTRAFTLTILPTVNCGEIVTLKFRVQDGRRSNEIITLDLQTGVPRTALAENFDDVSAPALPAGWLTSASGGQVPWISTVTNFASVPNSAFSPGPNQPGVNELISPAFPITSTDATLSFQNRYELETTFLRNRRYDGAVLEIQSGLGDWQDIIAAGGSFISGGYDGPLDMCCENPLAGRQAWSGRSGVNQTAEFIPTVVKLPSAAAGRTVRFRWRVGTDNGTSREGMYIDDVRVSDGFTCSCNTTSKARHVLLSPKPNLR